MPFGQEAPDVLVLVSEVVRSRLRNQTTGESRTICTIHPLKRVNWRFATQNARIKLKRFYPVLESVDSRV